ncbi:MAG: hypothetical protein ABJP79_18760 [Tateyamaria sp.]|uniref:helix-turn-helix domain-containing protein n=1 Tax=Tateyamaria sp. TaxID=1929288 RepID=UPI0032A0CD52
MIDNALYVQVSNVEGGVIGFSVVDLDNFGSTLDFEECEMKFGDLPSTNVQIGDQALHCLISFDKRLTCLLFNRATVIEDEYFCELVGYMGVELHSALGIDILLRRFSDAKAGEILRIEIERLPRGTIQKEIVYLFLCADQEVRSRELIHFRRFADVLLLRDGSLHVGLSADMELFSSSKLLRRLCNVFRPEEITDLRRSSVVASIGDTGETLQDSEKPKASQVSGWSPRKRPNKVQLGDFSGEDIVRLRTRLGYSRSEFAHVLGVSENRIKRWETNFIDRPIGYSSTKLDKLMRERRKEKRSVGKWLIKGGKGRQRNAQKVLRFLEGKDEIRIFGSFSRQKKQLVYLAVNPYIDFDHNSLTARSIDNASLDTVHAKLGGVMQVLPRVEATLSLKYIYATSKNLDEVGFVGVGSPVAKNTFNWMQSLITLVGFDKNYDPPDPPSIGSLRDVEIYVKKIFEK